MSLTCSPTAPAEEFACNGSIVEHEEMGKVIQLQGDQRQKIMEILIEEGIEKDTIKCAALSFPSRACCDERTRTDGRSRPAGCTVSKPFDTSFLPRLRLSVPLLPSFDLLSLLVIVSPPFLTPPPPSAASRILSTSPSASPTAPPACCRVRAS